MDKARIQTDKKLQKMEKKVNKIYKNAYGDISKDWIKFMDSHAPKLQKAYDALQEALKSGDKTAIDEAKEVYQRTAMNITVNNKRFQGMAEDTAAKISHTNEVALAYVNDQVPSIYTVNYNQFKNEKIKGYSFSLVNEQAVKNLATSDKTLLPTKKLDIPKDMRWNAKNINSQMVQGILQGESVPKLAKRLGTVTDMNRVSAIRNARTITTAAENKGRQDSFKKASDDGVIMEREWVAAHDDHTRAWHLDLHGVRVGVDEPWENEYGEIMYPADPSADPANVYNCRCSIRAVVKGFKWNETAQEEQIKETITALPQDLTERLQNSLGDAYEHHRLANGLNASALDELDSDFFKVTLTKMDDEVKEAFVNQFEALSSKYDTTVQQIRPMDKLEYMSLKDSFATTFHNYEVDSSTIIYNPVKINDIDRVKELVGNGYATQIDESLANKYVVTHEFAHTLIDMGSELDKSRNWLGADYKRIESIRKEITGVYDKYIGELGALDKAQKAAELDALTTFNADSWTKAAELSKELSEKSLGKYSMVNSDEFMAECFAHSELGGKQNDYVDAVMDIINKNFRR